MPSAIVTGATGITGSAIVHHLCKDPQYEKVYTLSRSNPSSKDPKIKHATLDLQGSAEEMAKSLKDISAEYVYFCAYLALDDPAELSRVNSQMLSNFIQALETTGAAKNLKRFVLTCGFKHYGVHLGHCKQPLIEDDPLLEHNQGGIFWPPIFYYEQEKILKDAAVRGQWEWIATLPEDVLGYARGNFMNEASALGLYCAVSKAPPGSQLPFPGCKANYFAFNCWTSANLHAKFCLWAATAPNTGNNVFNIPNPIFPRNGTPDTRGFGNYEATTIRMETQHPLAAHADKIGVAVNEAPTLFLQADPEKWAKREDVNSAWDKLRDAYKLNQKAWEKATWDFLTFVLGRDWSCVGTMSKARRLGWTGYADTWEELEETFQTLEKKGVLPLVENLRKDF